MQRSVSRCDPESASAEAETLSTQEVTPGSFRLVPEARGVERLGLGGQLAARGINGRLRACRGRLPCRWSAPLLHLILHVVPFPKSASTAPELLPTDDGMVDAIRADVMSLLERIAAGPREGAGPVHPLFGRLSFQQWGVATFKHTDHHLRQFGA